MAPRSITRREALVAGTAAATAAWVAPSITKVDSVAASQPSCKFDFTAGLGGWTIDNSTPPRQRPGLWGRSTARSFSGTQSLHYGRGIGGNYYYGPLLNPRSNAGQVTSELITLPSSAAQLAVSFRVWMATEDTPPYDTLSFSILDTLPPGNQVLWSSALSTGGAWSLISLMIPAGYAGHAVQFRFTFDTIDGIANTFEGVYLDNVYLPCRFKPNNYARMRVLPGNADFPPPIDAPFRDG